MRQQEHSSRLLERKTQDMLKNAQTNEQNDHMHGQIKELERLYT